MPVTTILKKIEIADLADWKREGSGVSSSDMSVIGWYKLQKQLGFVGSNGEALSEDTSVTIWYYRTPLTDGSEDISATVEPIVDQRWDDCLVFLACFYMTGNERWWELYRGELDRIRTLQLAQVNRTYSVPVNTDYD